MVDRLEGAFPAVVTPWRADGGIDLDAFRRRVAAAAAGGAAGVVVCGSTGEGPSVAPADRDFLVRAAVEVIGAGRVVAGVTGLRVDDLHRGVEAVAACGAAVALVTAPFYFPLSDAEQVTVHAAVAASAEVPTLVYHIPQMTGSELSVEAVAELARHDGIAGIKDSSGDVARLRRFVDATSGQRFGVFQGNGPGVLDALLAGAAGTITAIANLRLPTVVAIHAAVAAGDLDRGRGLQDELTALSRILAAAPGPLAVTVKALMELEGTLERRSVLPPLAPVDAAALDAMRDAVIAAQV